MLDLTFSSLDLARCHHLRPNQAELARLKALPQAAVLPFWQELSLFSLNPGQPPWASNPQAQAWLQAAPDSVFLGMNGDQPLFAVDISPQDGADLPPDVPGMQWLPLRGNGGLVAADQASWMAFARGMVMWHRTHRFCPRCGTANHALQAGHERRCGSEACNHVTYPRTDPAVIMLVQDGDRILLHRQKVWPVGMWSCLAGFVEPGESLEAAVRREVQEESGIIVDDIRYVASQPWPFPSSLMLAFTARAVGGSLQPDLNEIEDAQWFSLADLADFKDSHRVDGLGRFLAVPGTAARLLIEGWKKRKA